MRVVLLCIILLCIPVVNTDAREFGLSVHYESLKTVLEITEINKVKFPELLSNNATKAGADCKATGISNPNNHESSLCPGLIGLPGLFEIQGDANATVILTHTADHTVNGLRLTANEQATPIIKTLRLSASGSTQYSAPSVITLIDKDAAKTSDYYFIFDISVAYQ